VDRFVSTVFVSLRDGDIAVNVDLCVSFDVESTYLREPVLETIFSEVDIAVNVSSVRLGADIDDIVVDVFTTDGVVTKVSVLDSSSVEELLVPPSELSNVDVFKNVDTFLSPGELNVELSNSLLVLDL
jgi:hypothetical protein